MDSINWTGVLAYAVLIGIGVSVAMLIFSFVVFLARTVVKAIQSKRKARYLRDWRVVDGFTQNAVEFPTYDELPDEAIMEDLQNEVRDDPDLYMIIWKKKAITAEGVLDVADIYDKFHSKEDDNETETEGDDRGDRHDPDHDDAEDHQRDHVDPESDQRDDGRAA